jgi:lysozyme
MAADGSIDIYAKSDISIRSQGSMNLRADLDVNIEAGRSIFMKARNDPGTPLGDFGGGLIKMNANVDLHMSADVGVYMTAGEDCNRTAGGDILDKADGDGNYKAVGSVFIQGDEGDVDIKAAAEIHMTATNIHFNSVGAEDATGASDAEDPQDLQQKDAKVVSDGNIQVIVRDTIMYRLPYHEPYPYHGGSVSGTNGHVTAAEPKTDENLQLIRTGEISSNQDKPNDIVGSPRAGMPAGKYSGQSYDDKGNPVYKYEGGSKDLVPSGSLKISDSGLQFIKRYEGLKKTVYLDVAGLKTVGYGHLLTKPELSSNSVTIGGKKIFLDRALTDAEVDTLLRQDIEPKAQTVRSTIKTPLTQSQFDALVSLCFNIGSGAFASSTLAKDINAGNLEKAPGDFLMWCKAGGKTVKGLLNRRQAEASIFRGMPPTNH